MIKRFCGVLILLVIAAWAPASAVGAASDGDLHEELQFAQELRELGYVPLALDQLRRTREREYLPENVRLNATKLLARTLKQLGEQSARARDFSAKRENYRQAIKEYERFLTNATKEIVEDRERHQLLYERGMLCAELGRDAVTGMKGTAEQEESEEYRQTAIKWFEEARDDLKKATDFFVKLRETAYKGAESKDEKKLLREIRIQTGKVQMEYGKALYDFAGVYTGSQEEGETERHTQLLQDALKVFENVTEHYRIFAVRYKAYRNMGLCHRDLGSFEKAEEFLNKALAVERSSATEWIIRRARLNLAQTYNAWGEEDANKYEQADIAAAALVNEVYDRAMVTGDPALVDMLFAGWLEKGKAQVGHAQLLLKKAKNAKKQNKNMLSNQWENQAWQEFRWAVDKAKEISGRPESRWARNAKMHLDDWLDLSEEIFGKRIPVRKDISTYTSEGWRLFRDQKYLEAIERFQKAVEVGNPAVYGKTLIPESWYQMGLAYYKLSSPDHTGGKFNYYYEGALCFQQVAREYPQADFAADAGYYGMQLYGALFEQTRKRVRLQQMNESAKTYDGQRYYRALQQFSEQFPRDPRAADTMFQSAEVARALEQYGDASDIYASIKQDHPQYYEAKYRAGLCRYLQALKIFGEQEEESALETVGEMLDRAAGRYSDFIDWYEQNKDWLGSEQLEVVNRWIVRTKISYGKLLVHKAWTETHDAEEGANRALKVLEDVEAKHFQGAGRKELRKNYLPEAFFVTIQAYRRLDELKEAEEFVDTLVERFGQDELSAEAARFLGYAYLQRRQNLADGDGSEAEIKLAARSAGKYLQKALELQPEQSLQFYNNTAAQLYEMEEYEQAIRILEAGLQRFPIGEDAVPTQNQLVALGGIKDAYREQEEWGMVQQTVERLLDIENRQNEKRSAQGKQEIKNVNYRRDYALALEEQRKWEEALDYWREAKGLAENMEGAEGNELKFTATLHLARCYAQVGGADNVKHGYKVIAWYLLSNDDWLLNKDWASQVEELFANHFSDHWSDLADFTFQLVQADINLLRKQTSREIIVGLTDRRWPDRKDQLQKLLDKAEVGLGTGQ